MLVEESVLGGYGPANGPKGVSDTLAMHCSRATRASLGWYIGQLKHPHRLPSPYHVIGQLALKTEGSPVATSSPSCRAPDSPFADPINTGIRACFLRENICRSSRYQAAIDDRFHRKIQFANQSNAHSQITGCNPPQISVRNSVPTRVARPTHTRGLGFERLWILCMPPLLWMIALWNSPFA